jgi:hypothetical protein
MHRRVQLSEDHIAIRRSARDFAYGEIKPVAEELDGAKRRPRQHRRLRPSAFRPVLSRGFP